MKSSTGIRCPRCGGRKSKVIKVHRGDGYVRRRHKCRNPACEEALVEIDHELVHGIRWTTYEFPSKRPGVVTIPQDMRAVRLAHATGSP